MPDPSVRLPRTYTDHRGINRVVTPENADFEPAPLEASDRQKANAAERPELPEHSSPITEPVSTDRDATAV